MAIGMATPATGIISTCIATRSPDRFYFTPWGPDSAFWDPGPFLQPGLPKSFKARGHLCKRLWELPQVRTRYRKEMQRLLDEVWDEKKMLSDLEAGPMRSPNHSAR